MKIFPIFFCSLILLARSNAKYVEGHIKTLEVSSNEMLKPLIT